jgi:hypothetical protein
MKASLLFIYLHSCQFVAARGRGSGSVGEAEDRLGDEDAGRSDRVERCFQILHLDHWKGGLASMIAWCSARYS